MFSQLAKTASATAAAAAFCASLAMFNSGAAAAETWKFYMHQSAPNFATSRGAKLLTEEIEKATNGELKMQLHLSGTLQISPSNITMAVGENIVQLGDDLFNSGNIPLAGIPRLPMLVQSYEDFEKAAAVLQPYIEKAFATKGSTVLAAYSYPMQVVWGKKKLGIPRGHQGPQAARRSTRAGRVRAPVRRHVDHHERPGSAFRARSRRGGRHLHGRRRRRAVEGPAEVRLPDRRQRQQLLHHRQHRGLQQAVAGPAGQAAQGRAGHRPLEPGHHEDRGGAPPRRRWRMPATFSPRPNRPKSPRRSRP